MTFLKRLCFYLALSITAPALSQVIPVEPLTKGFFVTQQTMTMLHERRDAELIVIVIMGYPGHFDLKIEDSYVKNQTARMMRDLPSYRSKAKINVVIFDSPSLLQGISARSNNDHLNRIESVVKFYKEKFNLPIWLFGHSDGSISVSEFLNRSIDSRKSVAGAILSAGRDETRIAEDWKTPTLVLHHEKDACEVTTFYGAKRYFNRIKQTNTGPTEFATVIGGISSGAPCSTGYHMYQGAFEETLGLIEDFIGRHK
jgi:hypothetical protein